MKEDSGAVGVSFKMRKRRETGSDCAKRGQRRRARPHQSFPCMDLDGYCREALRPPSHLLWGLTHHLKLVTRQRFLRFSILKETPAAPQAFLVPPGPAKSVGHSQQSWGRGKGEEAKKVASREVKG
jgi:hypothetical protein